MPVKEIIEFLLFGIFVGTYGTLVGAGGGFIIVPVMLIFYHATPQQAGGTSLMVVFFNALSGTIAYVRQKKIDYQTGWRFALATVPGAIVGVYFASFFTGPVFSAIFGVFLILIATFLNIRPEATKAHLAQLSGMSLPPGYVQRTITDAHGETHTYAFNMRGGLALSFVVGFLSSILGIGGGIIHVPAMVFFFNFPAHLATATSHFVLAITSLVGTTGNVAAGRVLYVPALSMAVGAIVGARVGATISLRVKGPLIVRVLSLALVVVGLRLLYGAFFPS
jgi:uncharacterized membrane protein YfcA